MQNNMFRKGVVLAVIFLFVGIAIQPTIAVNPISYKGEEDCNICPKVSNLHLIDLKNLIKRLEILNNKLLVMSKLNPEVEEKYQELSDRITILPESIGRLKSLKYLFLSANFLTELPETLEFLPSLQFLNIEKNNLKGYLDFVHKLELKGIKISK